MQRFQRALMAHLEKQNEKVSLELRELQEAMKERGTERENVGVELYGVQQELARHQMLLEKNHDQYTNVNQHRVQIDQMLAEVQDLYRQSQFTVNKEKKKGKTHYKNEITRVESHPNSRQIIYLTSHHPCSFYAVLYLRLGAATRSREFGFKIILHGECSRRCEIRYICHETSSREGRYRS